MASKGFVTADGRFVAIEDQIHLASIFAVKGENPECTGIDVTVNPLVFEAPVLRERLPIDLRKIADQIENYKPCDGEDAVATHEEVR